MRLEFGGEASWYPQFHAAKSYNLLLPINPHNTGYLSCFRRNFCYRLFTTPMPSCEAPVRNT